MQDIITLKVLSAVSENGFSLLDSHNFVLGGFLAGAFVLMPFLLLLN